MSKIVVIDLFCGAGGTSLGFDLAEVNGSKVAEVLACVNHDPVAIRSHSANFPLCRHFTEDVRLLDVHKLPRKQPGDTRLWVLWASLECTQFSNAKTGPKKADSRTLANALFPYIDWIQPDLIKIENVREFRSWGDLDEKGKPVSRLKGRLYLNWRKEVESRGYTYSSRLLNSADYGAPQKRIRYFAVFARKGAPIVFPEPTHDEKGRYGLKPWVAVRTVLNLEDSGASIFNRKKPYCDNTLRRVLAGLLKFVPQGKDEYLVKHYGGDPASKVASLEKPAPTLTTIPHEALVTAERFLCQYNGKPEFAVSSDADPCNTITTKDRFSLATCFIDNQFGQGKPTSINKPSPALMTVPKKNLVSAFLMPTNFNNLPVSLEAPSPVITANRKWHYLVNPQYKSAGGSVHEPCFTLIAKMDKRPPCLVSAETRATYGPFPVLSQEVYADESIPVIDRIVLFMQANGLSDIRMRMLTVQELKEIQGLGPDYVLKGSQANQKKFIGNAVVPHVVKAWAEAYWRETFSVVQPQALQLF